MGNDPKKSKKPVKRKVDIKAFFVRIGKFFRNVVSELKLVTWPTKKDLISYSTVVVIFILVMAVIIFVMDLGLDALLKLVVGS
jgi:preprotein translocase subunit SecE